MKIEIKKLYVVGIVCVALLISGYFLFDIIFSALANEGLYGLLVSIIFLVSLVYTINYFLSFNLKIKTVKEASKEVVDAEVKSNSNLFHNTSPEALKSQIEARLINKIDEEKYVLWQKESN